MRNPGFEPGTSDVQGKHYNKQPGLQQTMLWENLVRD